ncbi:MAG: threonine synthase, partial [Lachnospiraceae bacterium]|nr:threonine synthase [Lachnospiraceae bacterium]
LEAIEPDFAAAKNVMDIQSAFARVDELTRISDMKIPVAVEELRQAPILHDRICSVSGMKDTVKEILGL